MIVTALLIAFLRGVNVGGHNKLSMNDLRKMLIELGYEKPITYIQSGNVVFEAEAKDQVSIEKIIRRAIKEKLSLNVEVIVKSKQELSTLIDLTPFKKPKEESSEQIYLTVFSEKPSHESIEKLKNVDGEGDKIEIIDKTAYVLCHKGYSKTVYNNTFIEKSLSVAATTRNLQTMRKMLEIAVKFC